MKHLLLLLIRFYQHFISPLFPASCRFYPTCSAYAFEAVSRFGFIKGGWLSLKRICHCHPFCQGGLDPVPESYHFFEKRRGKKKN